jgi:hypothetical protein
LPYYRSFQNVVEMVLHRLLQIDRAQLLLYWHHILENVFRFLDLQHQ